MSGAGYSIGKLTRQRTDGSKYWSHCIIWHEAGGRRRVSLGTTDKVAAKALARDYWAKLNHRQVQTIGEAMGLYLATFPPPFPGWRKPDAPITQKERTRIKDGVRKAEGWKQSQGFWAGLRPEEIDDETSEEYREWRQRSINTMRNELNHLRTGLNWAKAKGIISAAPKIVVPAIPDSSVDHLTKQQFARFIEGCKMPHVTLFAILAICTGARKSALLQLKWEQVDLTRRLVKLRPEDMEQNGKDRATVPLNDRAMQALCEAHEGRTSEYVIEYRGEPVADIKKGITAASERTEVPCHPHMFRHSAAVWMAEARTPMEEIASFLGHRDTKITVRVYARFHPDYLRRAAQALDWAA